MSVRRLTAALVVAAVLIGAGASSVLAAKSHSSGTTVVKVTASEFKFVLSPTSAKAGAVSFVVTNKGKLEHDFKIAGKKTSLLKPGQSGKVNVTLKKGSYPYMCTVPGHAAAGMKGTFKVK